MTASTVELPAINHQTATLHHLFACKQQRLYFQHAIASQQFAPQPAFGSQQQAVQTCSEFALATTVVGIHHPVTVQLCIGDQFYQLTTCASQLVAWLPVKLAVEQWMAMPEDIQLALIQNGLMQWSMLINHVAMNLTIDSSTIQWAPPLSMSAPYTTTDNNLYLAINCQSDNELTPINLYISAEPQTLTELIQALPDALPALAADHMLQPAQLQLGKTRLNKQLLSSISLGDILLFDECYFTEQRLKLLVNQQPIAWLSLDGQQAMIEQMMHTDLEQSQADNSPVNTLEDIPITVSIEVGELELTLAELQQLQPGQILNLTSLTTEQVNIKANGRLIGTGSLVTICDQLGLQVQSLNWENEGAGINP